MSQQPTRRDIVVGGAAMTLAAGQAAAEPQTQATQPPAAAEPQPAPKPPTGKTTATGTVTEIRAESGAGLTKGPPVENVIVSNGRDITRTDPSGRFSLPVEPGQAIFMVKPAGFHVPVDAATKLPAFSYVYDPEGTPPALGFRYRGLAPTGPFPASLDFQLTRVAEPQRFDVLLFTDPQPETTAELEFIRDDVVAGLVGADAAFGITCGDLMFDDLSMYHRYNRIVGRIGLPWWSVGGNHDLDYEAPDARRSRDTWKRVFGAPYYAHEHGNALFVMLDNVDYRGAGSNKPGEQHGAYRGFFPPDQLTFVQNLLAATPKDRLVVFVMHIPLRTYLDPTDPRNNTANAADLLRLIGDRPSVSFAGHTHSTEHHYFDRPDGVTGPNPHHHHVLTAVSGSWWSGPYDHRGIATADSWDGTPNGYHVLSIDGAAYATRYVPAAEPAFRQMRISLESAFHADDKEALREVRMEPLLRSPVAADQAEATRLVVNLFDGGPRSKVAFAIDGGAPILMTRVARPDPFIVQVYARHPQMLKPWVKPMKSSHVWVAPLPPDLRPGTYAIKVLAVDEYGRDHADGMVLEVE